MRFYISVFQQEEREKAVQNTADVSSGVWSSPAINGTGPNFDTAKVDAVKLVAERENGDDDPWDNGGWEFKVAEAKEPKRDLTNKVQGSFHKKYPCIGRGYKLHLIEKSWLFQVQKRVQNQIRTPSRQIPENT